MYSRNFYKWLVKQATTKTLNKFIQTLLNDYDNNYCQEDFDQDIMYFSQNNLISLIEEYEQENIKLIDIVDIKTEIFYLAYDLLNAEIDYWQEIYLKFGNQSHLNKVLNCYNNLRNNL